MRKIEKVFNGYTIFFGKFKLVQLSVQWITYLIIPKKYDSKLVMSDNCGLYK